MWQSHYEERGCEVSWNVRGVMTLPRLNYLVYSLNNCVDDTHTETWWLSFLYKKTQLWKTKGDSIGAAREIVYAE